jgi:hypothetical protein
MSSVLVLNAGSSYLKFAVIDAASGERALTGIAERSEMPEASIMAAGAMPRPTATASAGLDALLPGGRVPIRPRGRTGIGVRSDVVASMAALRLG